MSMHEEMISLEDSLALQVKTTMLEHDLELIQQMAILVETLILSLTLDTFMSHYSLVLS